MSGHGSGRPMTYHERAVYAAARRWGPPRHLSIADLTEEQRMAVLRVVESFRRLNNGGAS